MKIALVLALALMMAVAAGCSIKPGTDSSQSASSGGAVEITFWHGMSGQLKDVLDQQVAEFNESQDEVKVVATAQGTDYDTNQQKILAAIASDSPPDIGQIEIHALPKFADSGAVVPLDSFMEKSKEHKRSDFVQGILANTQYEGQTYGIPFNRSVPMLYYNVDMFENAGLSGPPVTWQEVADDARKLANPDRKIYGYEPVNEWWFFESMVWSNDGDILSPDNKHATFDTAEAQAGLEIWRNLKQDGVLSVTSGTEAWSQTISDFTEGRTAMYTGSAGDMGQIEEGNPDFEWRAAFVPKFDQYAVPTGGANAAIFSKDEAKQEAAWKFISWFTSKDQTILWSQKTGYLPVMKSAIDDPKMVKYFEENPNHELPVEQLKYARTAPEIPEYPQILDDIQEGMDQIMYSGKPVAPSLKAAARKADKDLSGSGS